MSFWSTLAKLGGAAAAGIAAPLTGGASLMSLPTILGAAGAVGGAMGGMGQGRAEGRLQQTGVNQGQDRLAQDRYRNQIDAAKVNLQAPSIRAGQSVKGDVLANAKPFTWTGGSQSVNGVPVPQFSGGLSPDLFSGNTRALGAQMSAQALKDNGAMGGKAIGDAPGITPPPQAGTLDKILNIAGTVGNFSDILGQYMPQGGAQMAQKKPIEDILPQIGNPSIPSFGGWANG